MLTLFKIEWLKVKTYRTFWLLFITFLIMFPLTFYFSADKYMEKHQVSMQEQMLKAFIGAPFQFPNVWHAAGWFGGLFFVMIGMLFILLITNEVQYRTHRQNIIDGWSRFDFLKAKLTMLIFFVLTATATVFLTGLITGLIYSTGRNNILDGIQYVGYFALMATLYLMVAFIIAITVKRTGLSIIFYFALVCIVDNLLWLLLTLKNNQAGYFLPLECADSLIPNPFKPKVMERRNVPDYALICAVGCYLVLFAFTITRYFRRTDLKT